MLAKCDSEVVFSRACRHARGAGPRRFNAAESAALYRLGLLDRLKAQPEKSVPSISALAASAAPSRFQLAASPASLRHRCSRLPIACIHAADAACPSAATGDLSPRLLVTVPHALRRVRCTSAQAASVWVCAAMHGCTHTVLVSTYSVSVVRHVLPIRIAPKTSSPCCKVAAVDLIGRLCYRLAVTFGAVSQEIFMTAPRFLDGIVFKRYKMS